MDVQVISSCSIREIFRTAALYKRLGNMVLMQVSKNSLTGNSSFSEKKKVLKNSAFILTSEVAGESKWEAKQIKDRQARLAKLAVETWPIL